MLIVHIKLNCERIIWTELTTGLGVNLGQNERLCYFQYCSFKFFHLQLNQTNLLDILLDAYNVNTRNQYFFFQCFFPSELKTY